MIEDLQLKQEIVSITQKLKVEDIIPYYMSDPGLPATHKFWQTVFLGTLPKNGGFYTSETLSCFWVDHKNECLSNSLTQKHKEILLLIGLLNLYYEVDMMEEELGCILEAIINSKISTFVKVFNRYCDFEHTEALVNFIYQSSIGESPNFNELINKSDTGWGCLFFDRYPGDAWLRLLERFFPKDNEYTSYIIDEIKKYKN